ncbi:MULTISPECIES: cytochrome P450 [Gordonia]|uniref:cytochrome P450 n=1 Tax=Gordonia TaxID=2053 RepID=UPI00071D1777|nr:MULTISPECIES: cytochrome P450 [Gordonia]KSU59557.1 cytochrome [Gordonia sp. SGD-V-85]MBR7190717.1 cytochrome P450 [Gordonia sp. SCSIO 19800]MCX2752785.1 cytochrome P450 [Gordonia sp. 4N]UPG69811.1 cytochrome P450 [Gordonia hongkongensis]SCB99911.1 Cytochrome P450 [Gordonia sp. v-85]
MDTTADPTTFYSRLHTGSPVQRIGDSSFFAVGSWDLIADAVRRPEDFSSNLTATMVWHGDGTVSEFPVAGLGDAMHVLATADGARHRDHRKLAMRSVSPARTRELEPTIRRYITEAWADDLRGGRIDWVSAVAQRIPMEVATAVIGLPVADRATLTRWAIATNVLIDGVITPDQLTTATAAVGELTAYLSAAMSNADNDTGAGSEASGPTALVEVARRVAEGGLDHETAVMILFQLVAAGAESTTSLLNSAVWLLDRHPDVVERLRSDPGLIPVFVEEALRLETPFRGHFRHVVADTTLGDSALPAGSHVFLMWGAANRDPAHFDDPGAIDLDPAARRSHLAFGKGLHLCVGATLARLQARLAVEHLLRSTTAFRVDLTQTAWEPGVLVRRFTTLPLTITR